MRISLILAVLASSASAQVSPVNSTAESAGAAKTPNASSIAPAGDKSKTPLCKVIPGDLDWPVDEVWMKEIPGVIKTPVSGNITSPTWLINAKGSADVQAAVKFAAKHNVRISVVNSGHDFMGR
jgi:hypothetical protein